MWLIVGGGAWCVSGLSVCMWLPGVRHHLSKRLCSMVLPLLLRQRSVVRGSVSGRSALFHPCVGASLSRSLWLHTNFVLVLQCGVGCSGSFVSNPQTCLQARRSFSRFRWRHLSDGRGFDRVPVAWGHHPCSQLLAPELPGSSRHAGAGPSFSPPDLRLCPSAGLNWSLLRVAPPLATHHSVPRGGFQSCPHVLPLASPPV